MSNSALKEIQITIFEQNHIRREWFYDFDGSGFQQAYVALKRELGLLGVFLSLERNRDTVITVNSYADLLNAVRVSSPADGHANQCVGHIIGKSERLDIMDDLRTAVRRIAFAPETVAPSSEFRKVCHNCGCGC
ncbi:MAG TPA: hypothetical protein HPP76_01940 [Desulfuromonadales bacterium]|nr:hypothetical protein [Desulfuromonadales bacterium]